LSSQFLTGLLMAFAAAGPGSAVIRVRHLKSKPYIDLTLEVMRKFGVHVAHEDYTLFRFPGAGSQNLFRPSVYTVEADWSGAAFLLVAGALRGGLMLRGLD